MVTIVMSLPVSGNHRAELMGMIQELQRVVPAHEWRSGGAKLVIYALRNDVDRRLLSDPSVCLAEVRTFDWAKHGMLARELRLPLTNCAWKPKVIEEVLREAPEGAIVTWLDASMRNMLSPLTFARHNVAASPLGVWGTSCK